MYKKEKQGIIHLLMIVAALLVIAILLEWHSAIMWMSVAFVVVLVWLIFDFHQRLAKLEQRAVDNQTQTLPIPSKVPQDAISQEERLSTEPFTPDWMQTEPTVQNPIAEPIQPRIHQVKAKEPTWYQPAIDWMIHGNPILRVAVAILMVGVVLLLRFASEHWQLSLGVKLAFIGTAGVITTFAGYWFRKKNQLFAVALQGLGLAVVFLTLVFSHHFSVLASLTTASILFVILLAATVYLSLQQRALYLAILALTMAYVAPLVIPQTHPDVIFLFGYYLIINLAVAAVNFIQPWKILHQIAFFATMFIGGAVIGIHAKTVQFQTLDVILWLHIALFIWLSIRYSQLMLHARNESLATKAVPQSTQRLQPILDVGLIFSVPVLGFSLHAYLMHQSTPALTWGAVALAAVYIALSVWIKRQHPQLSILAKSFFILAVVFVALIFPLANGAHWTSTGWVIQGTALIVWGVTERYRLSRYVGVALVLLSSIALMLQIWSNQDFPILSTAIFALAQFISAFYLLHYQEAEKYFSAKFLSGIFLILGMYVGAMAGVEWLHWQQYGVSPYLAVAVILLTIFSFAVHFRSKLQWERLQLILISGLFFLMLCESFAADVYTQFHWQSLIQQGSFAVAALGLIVMLLSMQKNQFVFTIWSTCLWLSLAVLGIAIFPIMPIVALAIIPVMYGLWLFKTHQTKLLTQLPVWCLSLFWLILVSVDAHSAEQYYFMPLLNFTDVLSLLVLAGVLWVKYRIPFGVESSVESGFKIAVILIGLLVLSSVVVRAMHHYMGTPLWSEAIWHNGEVQLSLTLLWVILAFILMTFSSRRHIRQIWFVGAALLAIVVAKLLLLDLSQSGTLTRVISFIGSGAIMLVIAYLAPLPPALEESQKES